MLPLKAIDIYMAFQQNNALSIDVMGKLTGGGGGGFYSRTGCYK